jgi:hypothetical protein
MERRQNNVKFQSMEAGMAAPIDPGLAGDAQFETGDLRFFGNRPMIDPPARAL